MMTRLGIYGGTFDPPHLGHLILAESAATALHLDRVLFVPAATPPHKTPSAIRSSAEHRYRMVEHAIADNPRFALSRLDMDRPGPHYSVDLLHLLRDQHPQASLFFLIGSDSLRDLPNWSRPDELIHLATLAVMRRPGADSDLNALENVLPGITQRVQWIDAPLITISASDIAARVAAGQSIRYRVTESVRRYIAQHGLYQDETG